jgi:hypothetical protein
MNESVFFEAKSWYIVADKDGITKFFLAEANQIGNANYWNISHYPTNGFNVDASTGQFFKFNPNGR